MAKQNMAPQEAIVLLSQMYLPQFDDEEKAALSVAIKVLEKQKEYKETPTADVVEVVRCKDCENYKPYKKPVEDFDGCCIVRECETDENEFCSYGVRRSK